MIHGGATRPGTVPKKKPAAKPAGKAKPKAAPKAVAPVPAAPVAKAEGSVQQIPIHQVVKSPWQPRREFKPEALQEPSDSIMTQGVIQPVVVRQVGKQFELIAGERRFRASQAAGLTEIPALLRDVTDLEAMEMALIENVQREDLSPIEEGEGYRRLIEEFSHTQEKLASLMGKSRSHIANTLRLLSLPDSVKEMIRRGILSKHKASANRIKAWVRKNPNDGRRILQHNPSFVFFRELKGLDPTAGPPGAMGVSVSTNRTIAVDPKFTPLGAPVWIDKKGKKPIQRLMIAQDVGSAIKGAQRADVYYGSGAEAGRAAGRIKDAGRMYTLLPHASVRRLLPEG